MCQGEAAGDVQRAVQSGGGDDETDDAEGYQDYGATGTKS
jgi:hypothetical protein